MNESHRSAEFLSASVAYLDVTGSQLADDLRAWRENGDSLYKIHRALLAVLGGNAPTTTTIGRWCMGMGQSVVHSS